MDFERIFQTHRVECRPAGTHKHSRRGWISVDCPWCSPNLGRFRLGFEEGGQRRCRCWTCGGKSSVVALSRVCRIGIEDARQILLDAGPRSRVTAQHKTTRLKLPKGIGDFLPAHINYLRRRGFDPDELAETWGVRGIGPVGDQKWRLYIPIYLPDGTQVSWTSRAISAAAKIRYISAAEENEAVPHKSILYGAHLANDRVAVVEGPLDAWALGSGAVATCGVGYTPEQMALLSQYAYRVVCFDASYDAQVRAEALCSQLSMFPGSTINVCLETGEDPAAADKSEILAFRQQFLD